MPRNKNDTQISLPFSSLRSDSVSASRDEIPAESSCLLDEVVSSCFHSNDEEDFDPVCRSREASPLTIDHESTNSKRISALNRRKSKPKLFSLAMASGSQSKSTKNPPKRKMVTKSNDIFYNLYHCKLIKLFDSERKRRPQEAHWTRTGSPRHR